MAYHEFRYLHQTVEHCMKVPTPDNVQVAYRDKDTVVYTVDLPASVFAAVTMSVRDPYDNAVHRFPTESLRQEWLDNYTDSVCLAIP